MAKSRKAATKARGVRSALARYDEKRDFSVTSEPAPQPIKKKKSGQPLTFMVHKHDARRLHYDLRLELNGVLASWAIPKGPSYDPSIKRLAVETEDHPFEYGKFEGRIPDGEYGAGDSLIWDRGTYDTVPPGMTAAQKKKGHLHLDFHGEKMKGQWHLVRTRPAGNKAQWLCFKAKDGNENPSYDVVAERPESVASGRRVTRGPVSQKTLHAHHPSPDVLLQKVWPPMKATLSTPESAPAEEFSYEIKYDGFRGLAALSGRQLAFKSRNGLDFSARFPRVASALSELTVGEAVLDGEVVSLDSSGVSRFQSLVGPNSEERYVAFDLLWLEGEDLRNRPLEERREMLESLLSNAPKLISLSEKLDAKSTDEAMAQAKKRNLEGLVAKRRGSKYVGARSSDWLKLKLAKAQEFAIVGMTPISNGQKAVGALFLATYDGGQFHYAGKVGTGYTSKLRAQLWKQLQKDIVPKAVVQGAPRERDALWLKPRLVAQVAFGEWTSDGRLRHPSFQGLRSDKSPEECTRELVAKLPPERSAPAKVAVTHPERVLFPKSKITKGDVFAYYESIAEVMVPALAGRPLALQQWPKGIGAPGFFRQKASSAPEWMREVEVPHGEKLLKHWVVDTRESLAWLANQSALTLHMWNARVPNLDNPDWVLFDLDPIPGDFSSLITVARALKGLLDELKLTSVPKTSGKRGLHIFVPLASGHTQEQAVGFAVAITGALESALGEIATTERSVSKRGKRLYLDAYQNGKGKTVVAPYSIRGEEGAPVSTPLAWDEVNEKLDPSSFNLRTVPKRVAKVGDLFAPALSGKNRLPRFGAK
jgi:bifunctional non-homologous end joining protein LigD